MGMILCGFSILALFLIWGKIWLPTLLDTTRDNLFDVRDEARAWFLKEGHGLDHPQYRALSMMLNCHLRQTEHATFSSYLAHMLASRAVDDDDSAGINHELEALFETDDKKITAFVKAARVRAANILFSHMVLHSFFLSVIALLLSFVLFIGYLCRYVVRSFSFHSGVPAFPVIMLAVVMYALPCFAGNTRMERYSYTQRAQDSCQVVQQHG